MLAHVAEYIEIVIFYNTYSCKITVFKKNSRPKGAMW